MNRAQEIIGGAALCAVLSALFVWVLVNWFTGCGETFYTATGTVRGDCVGFLELWGL